MALVPDISGVCSMEGTFEISSKPTKIASTKMNRTRISTLIILSRFGDEFFVHNFSAVRDEAALDDFVVELENKRFVLLVPEFLDEGQEVCGVNLAGDRKSTRLNSSHPSISYAVFCL